MKEYPIIFKEQIPGSPLLVKTDGGGLRDYFIVWNFAWRDFLSLKLHQDVNLFLKICWDSIWICENTLGTGIMLASLGVLCQWNKALIHICHINWHGLQHEQDYGTKTSWGFFFSITKIVGIFLVWTFKRRHFLKKYEPFHPWKI